MRPVFLALAVLVGVTSCTTSSGGPSAVASTPPASSPAAAQTTPPPTSPATPSQAPPTSAGPEDCTTRNLSVTLSGTDGGAGHSGLVIRFRNNGPVCLMKAYPGVDGTDASGRAVVHATRTPRGYLGGPGQTKVVTVQRGAFASALLEGTTGPVDDHSCPQYVALLVTPPNETHSVRLPVRGAFCQPTIHPVVAGTTGGSNVAS